MTKKETNHGNLQLRAVAGSLLGGIGGGAIGLILGPSIGRWLMRGKPITSGPMFPVLIDLRHFLFIEFVFVAAFGISMTIVGAVLGTALATSRLGKPESPPAPNESDVEELKRLRNRIERIEENQRRQNEKPTD